MSLTFSTKKSSVLSVILAVRSQLECAPKARNRRATDAGPLRHLSRAPVRRAGGYRLECGADNLLDFFITQLAVHVRAGSVAQAVDPHFHKPIPPLAHGVLDDAHFPGDGHVVLPVGASQHDACSLRQSLRNRPSANVALQLLTLFR